MRKITFLLGLGFVLGMATVQAAEAPFRQQAKGGFHTSVGDSKVISGSAEVITGISFSCGGTACEVALYDVSDIDNAANAKGVWEDNAAANTGKFIDLSDSPIRTTTGVTVQSDGNESAVVVYTQQSRP